MNAPVFEESFVSYIRTSLSLTPSFRSLFTTLSATAHQTGKRLTSADVIWHLTEEATSIKIEDNINKANAAMLVATLKTKGEKGKGEKSAKSSKDNKQCMNTANCGQTRHTIDQCWKEGVGKAGQAPDWWKKKNKGKKPSANIAEGKSPEKDEPENYAMATFDLPDDPEALVCTSDFRSEAHAISNHSESIIDSGASRHFSPECSKFINYEEFINSEPI